ncbi:hypothetical protein [Chitinimonas sp.]|uniref:hypothetical protein n=1 Tax=Chitinimonas sp. TaxID=1934313 RepID=UPI0035B0429B
MIVRHTAIALALLSAACGSAMAHTVVQTQVTEGATTYNNLVIGHGCTLADGSKQPVIAQSVVFPTIKPTAAVTAGAWAGPDDVFSITSLAGVGKLVQSRDIFAKQSSKLDAKGNVIGFTSLDGSLDTSMTGLVPFRTAGISFKPNACATKLIVKLAVADICQKNGARNLWIPALTPKFNDPKVDGIGAAPSLIFNRDLVKNPLPASCGTGYELTLTPSAEDIDANLPIPGYLD